MPVVNKSLRQESRDRYLTYALSVVSGRALPDVRDGLKPVQRRILYAMLSNLKLRPEGSHKKSAAVIGEVLAKYHPHGDVACYEAMVRMAQDFSYRNPLVDGQGNFGSLDGDSPAAYRYTEVKLRPIALEVLGEIFEEAVNFADNFDASAKEPVVLPSKFPNLLVNGSSGIAVGMATSIPPHNLRDTIKAVIAYIEDKEISTAKLSQIIKAPDFPTCCEVHNTRTELTKIYQTGRGAIKMRATWKIEEEKRGKRFIIVTTIPYGVNKSHLVEKIANVIIDKKVPQLIDIRDESTEVVRVVMELANPEADADIAMAYLLKNTPLEQAFQVNLTGLIPLDNNNLRPELLSLKQLIEHYVDFRIEVVDRRLSFELRNLEARVHILEGFVIIFDALDEAIKIVRSSSGRSDAAGKLVKRFKLSEIQSFAVVDLRIYQLSKTNIDDITTELNKASKRIADIKSILSSKEKIENLVIKDLQEVSDKYGEKRISTLVQDSEEIEVNAADYVVQEEVYAIVTKDGWIKRIRQNNDYTTTRIREGDSILRAHPLSTVDYVGIITNHGMFYVIKVLDFQASSGYGTPVQKLLKFSDGEKVIESFAIESPDFESTGSTYEQLIKEGDPIILISKNGTGFAITMENVLSTKRNGKRLLKLRPKDECRVAVKLENNCAFFTKKGQALSISKKEIPVRSNAAVGVALMGLKKDDEVVDAFSYKSKTKFKVYNTQTKEKDFFTDAITRGARALKGSKLVKKGDVIKVEKEIN
jgi:DNA gyrase subunit A